MTICDRCNRTLIDKLGVVYESSNFDSTIAHFHKNDYKNNIIFAFCDKCLELINNERVSKPIKQVN